MYRCAGQRTRSRHILWYSSSTSEQDYSSQAKELPSFCALSIGRGINRDLQPDPPLLRDGPDCPPESRPLLNQSESSPPPDLIPIDLSDTISIPPTKPTPHLALKGSGSHSSV